MNARRDTSFFWLKRIQTLIRLFPLFAYFIGVLLVYSTAIVGPESFNRTINLIHSFPLTTPLEIVFVGLPLAFYFLMGLILIYRASANVVTYGYYKNWMYFLDKLLGLVAAAFIIHYVWMIRISTAAQGKFPTYELVRSYLAPMWTKVFFVVGIFAIAFHLSHGMVSSLITWGVLQRARAQQVMSIVAWVMTVIIVLWGLRILFAFI